MHRGHRDCTEKNSDKDFSGKASRAFKNTLFETTGGHGGPPLQSVRCCFIQSYGVKAASRICASTCHPDTDTQRGGTASPHTLSTIDSHAGWLSWAMRFVITWRKLVTKNSLTT